MAEGSASERTKGGPRRWHLFVRSLCSQPRRGRPLGLCSFAHQAGGRRADVRDNEQVVDGLIAGILEPRPTRAAGPSLRAASQADRLLEERLSVSAHDEGVSRESAFVG
jgi:hypothetical protein